MLGAAVCMCVYVLSCVQLFAIPGTVTHHASLSIEFYSQVYWSGLPFPSLGDLNVYLETCSSLKRLYKTLLSSCDFSLLVKETSFFFNRDNWSPFTCFPMGHCTALCLSCLPLNLLYQQIAPPSTLAFSCCVPHSHFWLQHPCARLAMPWTAAIHRA